MANRLTPRFCLISQNPPLLGKCVHHGFFSFCFCFSCDKIHTAQDLFKMYSSVAFCAFRCAPLSSFDRPKIKPRLWSQSPHVRPLTNLPSASVGLPVVDLSCKWNPAPSGLVSPASFVQPDVPRFAGRVTCIHHSFLGFGDNPQCGLSHIYFNLSFYSLADGHVGCFHFGAIMCNAAVDPGV